MQYRINLGDAIPQFSAKDQEGFEITTEDLFGSPVVLYFYPKDDTPGCTKEACSFRDNRARLEKYDVVVIGISPDSEASHRQFIEKHALNFTLLQDPKQEVCKKFDVIREDDKGNIFLERTTFFIDRDGIVQWLERPVNVEGHVDRLIAAIEKLKP